MYDTTQRASSSFFQSLAAKQWPLSVAVACAIVLAGLFVSWQQVSTYLRLARDEGDSRGQTDYRPATVAQQVLTLPLETPSEIGLTVFGQVQLETPTVIAVEALPVTELSLTLSGIFLEETSSESSALIAQPQSPAIRYYSGDPITDTVTLTMIHKDAVVLETPEGLQSLYFPNVSTYTP